MVNPALDDLNSIGSSGQINKEFVYFRSYGKQRRRTYFIPVNPKTPRQEAKRAFFKNGMAYWKNLSEEKKQEYNERAKIIKNAWIGYNYFMRLWLRGEIVQEVIKSIQRGKQFVPHGLTNISIVAVNLAKSVISYNAFLAVFDTPSLTGYGVEGASLTSPTNIAVNAWDTALTGTVIFCWQVIEYY